MRTRRKIWSVPIVVLALALIACLVELLQRYCSSHTGVYGDLCNRQMVT